ncbi:hypothetical protein CAPTEDRAFT_191415 [Capitella teleta]|uniref:Uncharacterized protein n=1 Tax=Capitella teleta TaxID=283909 RepID=R7TPL3_CAPTE|nr:hypothetical protein CAPTEDRAFT_191415 [Capitella teleta]|eukprot:ELT93456.1 hypothetical protein CAPTEDRAFT_191415 [Capitella teleta]
MNTASPQDANDSLSTQLPPCGDSPSSDHPSYSDLTVAPFLGNQVKKGLKVYNVQPHLVDSGNRLYLSYEPMNGVQTASILGSCLFLVIIYICYKSKCRKSSWSSDDQLYLERYRRKIHDRCRKNNNRLSGASSRWSTGKDPMRESFALENTAKWIQSQPLHTEVPKRTIKTVSNMCNICIDSCHSAMCPMCSDGDIHTLLPDQEAEVAVPDENHQEIQKCLQKHRKHNIPKSVNMEQQENNSPQSNHLNPSPRRLEQCRSTCSSRSDSIDLDKHIDIAIHNKSPEQHRAMKPRLKYIPLFTLPVTNITLIPSTNLSPKTPLCEKYTEDKARRKARLVKRLQAAEGKVPPVKPEGFSMKELGQGLRFIDSADEHLDDEAKSPLKLSVSNL